MAKVWPLDTALSFDPIFGEPNRDGNQGYEILPDGRVTMRIIAPNAKEVLIDQFGRTQAFEKKEDGYWEGTFDMGRGFQYFFLKIDGADVLNPYLPIGYGCCRPMNFMDIPVPDITWDGLTDIPHGAVTRHYVMSSVTGKHEICLVYTPPKFDPNKKYPTIIYVYGGPHAHNVDARWNYCSRGWETYMAQKGYLMFILDNRGSENRGRDFEQATFRQLGQIEMQDQIKGVEFLKSLPYVDANRIGVHGWSFGGFMTISLMTNYPDIFKVGVAGGPVIDWKWYEVMYGERYMDTPQQNPDGYAKTSLLSMAKNLKGKLQIISGYNDNTVVPQHCLSFIYQCNLNGTQPDLYIYPGEGHNMRGHQSTHLHERISQYFDDYLK